MYFKPKFFYFLYFFFWSKRVSCLKIFYSNLVVKYTKFEILFVCSNFGVFPRFLRWFYSVSSLLLNGFSRSRHGVAEARDPENLCCTTVALANSPAVSRNQRKLKENSKRTGIRPQSRVPAECKQAEKISQWRVSKIIERSEFKKEACQARMIQATHDDDTAVM